MADGTGQADIRGIDIDKLAKGFADEALLLKRFVTVSKTKAREIRWYQKTAGFLDSTDTTGITLSQIVGQSELSLPVVIGQTWTRTTSYVKKFIVDSRTISEEDIKDSDPDVFGTTIRDLVRAVGFQVDRRIYDVITEATTSGTPNPTNVNTATATADGWNDTATGDPIKDINTGIKNFRDNSYDPSGYIIYMNPAEEQHLKDYLISVKGSSIPQFSSQQVTKGSIMEILGGRVVVSVNATTDWVIMWIPNKAATWKSFTPITSHVISDPGIGKKIRVLERGECLLTDPKAVHVIEDTIV
jgi:hypothetical protein